MSDEPRHHLTFAEGLGFGLILAATATHFYPRAGFVLTGLGWLLAVWAMNRNGVGWSGEGPATEREVSR